MEGPAPMAAALDLPGSSANLGVRGQGQKPT